MLILIFSVCVDLAALIVSERLSYKFYFYKRSNHEESFRANENKSQELSKVSSCVQSTTS